jgi:uncharacterized protein
MCRLSCLGREGAPVDDGLFGNYFPAPARDPGILMLGGSEGGLTQAAAATARELQSEGFSVLQLSYFRAPGQNPRGSSSFRSSTLPLRWRG